MSRPTSPCPACAYPRPTEIVGGEIVRERCPRCFPARPFVRPAAASILGPFVEALSAAFLVEAAKVFRVPPPEDRS